MSYKELFHSHLDLINKYDDIDAFCLLLEIKSNIYSILLNDYLNKQSKYYIILDAIINRKLINIDSIFKHYLILDIKNKINFSKYHLKKLIYHCEFKYFRILYIKNIRYMIQNIYDIYSKKTKYFLKFIEKNYLYRNSAINIKHSYFIFENRLKINCYYNLIFCRNKNTFIKIILNH